MSVKEQARRQLQSSTAEALLVAASFLLLAIIYTWPLLPSFFSKTPWLGLTTALLANAGFILESLSGGRIATGD